MLKLGTAYVEQNRRAVEKLTQVITPAGAKVAGSVFGPPAPPAAQASKPPRKKKA